MRKALTFMALALFLSATASPPAISGHEKKDHATIIEKKDLATYGSADFIVYEIAPAHVVEYVAIVDDIQIAETPVPATSTEIIAPKNKIELAEYRRERMRQCYAYHDAKHLLFTGVYLPGFGPLYYYGSSGAFIDFLDKIPLFPSRE